MIWVCPCQRTGLQMCKGRRLACSCGVGLAMERFTDDNTVTEIIRGKHVHVGWSINTHIHLLSVSREPRSSHSRRKHLYSNRVSKYHSPLKGTRASGKKVGNARAEKSKMSLEHLPCGARKEGSDHKTKDRVCQRHTKAHLKDAQ